MTTDLEIISRRDAPAWDALVEKSGSGTLFHRWDWLETAARHTGSRLYPVVVNHNGVPIGLIPLFSRKAGLIRTVFSPPPRAGLFYLGPVLVRDSGSRRDRREADYLEFSEAVERFMADELNPDLVRISLSPHLPDPRPFTWSGYTVEPLYDYATDLSQGAHAVFESLPNKIKQDINRTTRRGISVYTGEEKEFQAVIDLMVARYDDQAKISTIPRAYFTEIYRQFKDSLTVFVAVHGEEIVTGLIDVKYQDQIFSWIGNPRPRGKTISVTRTSSCRGKQSGTGAITGFANTSR